MALQAVEPKAERRSVCLLLQRGQATGAERAKKRRGKLWIPDFSGMTESR